jgi:GcrA cell cycle regulator
MEWTDERVEQLKTLWLSGASAKEISVRLGGASRNAVIGKVHRLGLGGRGAPATPRGVAGAAPRRLRSPAGSAQLKPKTQIQPEHPGQATASMPATRRTDAAPTDLAPTAELLSLHRHSCRWPVGHPDDADFGFCGRNRDARTPYCEHHSQQARRRSSLSPSYIDKLAAIR